MPESYPSSGMMIIERNKPKKNKAVASNCSRTSAPTFLINAGISQPKIRIPKLLAKTMQRSRQHLPQKATLPKKMISILCSVFGSKKSKGDKLEEPHKAISRQGSSRRMASGRQKVRMARPIRKKVEKERGDAENNVLWKKKILMGGKCKPVNFSESAELGHHPGDIYWGCS